MLNNIHVKYNLLKIKITLLFDKKLNNIILIEKSIKIYPKMVKKRNYDVYDLTSIINYTDK